MWAARTLFELCEDVAISPLRKRFSPRHRSPDIVGPVLALSSLWWLCSGPWLAQRLPLVAMKMKRCSSAEIERPWCLDVRALCLKRKVTVLERRSSDVVLPV